MVRKLGGQSVPYVRLPIDFPKEGGGVGKPAEGGGNGKPRDE